MRILHLASFWRQGFLEVGKGQVKAYWQPEYQAFLEEKGEKRSENLLSRNPSEKPDTD